MTIIKKNILSNTENATIIFKEIYESIRQLGDALWWLEGYEVLRDHDVSLLIFKDLELKDKYMLNYAERFKKIRNDASYRGFQATEDQATEIIEFWDKCGTAIVRILREKLKLQL